ncbi:MAG: Gfo/Idh/MocA family oxidoreductase [Clostridia bacterium]|nr:Gfo/Idh/MocA family oxidoreductase [Clostridia bacterium]
MEKIRLGIVGFGSMGLNHAKAILSDVPEAELTAVSTRSGTYVEPLRQMKKDVQVFRTAQELYAAGVCDAVLIATPHRQHVEQTMQAFDAGLHVLLEKPTGVCTAEVRRLNEVADRSGLVFGAMFNQRTNPVCRKMREIVASGEYGAIRRTNVIITDWLRAQSYYESSPWRATWKQDGGGVLLNQAPHNLDLWQWICGMPARVHAFCGFGRWHDVEIEDDVTAYAEYANGAAGTFITCTGETPGTNRFEISMDGGQLVWEHNRLLLRVPQTTASQFICEYSGGYGKPEVTVTDITPQEDYPKHAGVTRAFARHLLYGEPMVADGREGLQSLMLANAMVLSAWTGRTIELPMGDEDEALYARMLEERAALSRERQTAGIRIDPSASF